MSCRWCSSRTSIQCTPTAWPGSPSTPPPRGSTASCSPTSRSRRRAVPTRRSAASGSTSCCSSPRPPRGRASRRRKKLAGGFVYFVSRTGVTGDAGARRGRARGAGPRRSQAHRPARRRRLRHLDARAGQPGRPLRRRRGGRLGHRPADRRHRRPRRPRRRDRGVRPLPGHGHPAKIGDRGRTDPPSRPVDSSQSSRLQDSPRPFAAPRVTALTLSPMTNRHSERSEESRRITGFAGSSVDRRQPTRRRSGRGSRVGRAPERSSERPASRSTSPGAAA